MAEALRLEGAGSCEKTRAKPLATAPGRRAMGRNAMARVMCMSHGIKSAKRKFEKASQIRRAEAGPLLSIRSKKGQHFATQQLANSVSRII